MGSQRKSKGGRPPFEPTDEQRYTVEVMTSGGWTEDQIAGCLGIDPKTLRKHFRDELDNGDARFLTKVYESLGRQALSGNVGAACFILKTRAGFSEKVVNEHTGPGGGPIQTETTIDPSGLSDQALSELMAAKGGKDNAG